MNGVWRRSVPDSVGSFRKSFPSKMIKKTLYIHSRRPGATFDGTNERLSADGLAIEVSGIIMVGINLELDRG